MKKIFIIIGIVLILSVIATGLHFYFSTQDYWKNKFNEMNQLIELRTEESVDSLINVLNYQDSVLNYQDSIVRNHESIYTSIKNECDSIVDFYKKDNKKLMDIINHQNQMIDKLMKN